ncbi:MAG: hypothetical protein V2I82_13165 [Halieaceae bacterium]|jgi:hypothetical protein|nr:hypothetical protein [Halieaceae bacterium]
MRAAICVFLIAFAPYGLANTPPPDIAQVYPDAAMSQKEFVAACTILGFSFLCFLIAVALRRFAGFSDENVIRILALVLIVSGTLFLVAVGYSAEQIAPALGLLGTVAGYMLGRADRDDKSESRPGKKPEGS